MAWIVSSQYQALTQLWLWATPMPSVVYSPERTQVEEAHERVWNAQCQHRHPAFELVTPQTQLVKNEFWQSEVFDFKRQMNGK